VIDGQTDGLTELPWHIRAIAYMLSRVKTERKYRAWNCNLYFCELHVIHDSLRIYSRHFGGIYHPAGTRIRWVS